MKNCINLKKLSALLLALTLIMGMAVPAFAFSNMDKTKKDDAYVIGRKTSYVNPDTNLTADGGDNSPIGSAMANNLVDKKLMVETVKGKTYITFSMVGMLFSKDFKVEIIGKDGKLREAKHTVTYTSQTESLGTQHFRIEVKPTDKYISPSLFVYAMGRRVQFFITPDFSSAVPGCGPFVSKFYPDKYERETQKDMSGFLDLIPGAPNIDKDTGDLTTTPNTDAPAKTDPTKAPEITTAAPETTTVPATTLPPVTVPPATVPAFNEEPAATEPSTEQAEEEDSSNTTTIVIIAAVVVIVAAAAAIGTVIYRKKHFI